MIQNNSNLLPDDAPFTSDQIKWLNSFLPTLQSDQLSCLQGSIASMQAGNRPNEANSSELVPLTILYGTESGNAEALAEDTAKAAENFGFKTKT